MDIFGFTKTTLLDYPGHVACTIFTGGCNFRCPFCHNYDLVIHPDIYPKVEEADIFSHLEKRKNVLSGICISGGEPTLWPDILEFLAKLKATGKPVKLDTNGYRPDVLENAIKESLVDYVAMDIKAGRANYDKACGAHIDISKIEKSVEILTGSGIPYEFRTTCVKGIHTEEDFIDIARWLPSDAAYYLQSFKENDTVPDKSISSFSKEELTSFVNILIPSITNVTIRGVD